MQVAGKNEPRTGFGIFFSGTKKPMTLNMRDHLGTGLDSDIKMVGRKPANPFNEYDPVAAIRAQRNCHPFAQRQLPGGVGTDPIKWIEGDEVAVRVTPQGAPFRQVIEEGDSADPEVHLNRCPFKLGHHMVLNGHPCDTVPPMFAPQDHPAV